MIIYPCNLDLYRRITLSWGKVKGEMCRYRLDPRQYVNANDLQIHFNELSVVIVDKHNRKSPITISLQEYTAILLY